jgi:thiamine biosynthesis lipoprotein
MKKKVYSCAVILGLLVSLLQGCGTNNTEKKVSKSGFYFDTIITITLYGTEDEAYIDSCFALAGEYEDKFSNTIETSEISQINQAGGKFVSVSDETIEVLTAGMEYGKISGGLFDITIGDLSDLWNFSEIAENLESEDNEADASVLPSEEAVRTALSHVDYRKIEIDGNRVRLADPDSKIDVGGIAKGYIADRMRAFLNGEGITAGVISLGGNVLTLGEKTSGADYTIGIQKPFAETGTALGTIKVKDASVVSSGIYERYYRVNGTLYHHILDTTTGYPISNNLEQVTIISEKSMDGDALSTTCFALGLDDGMQLVEQTDSVEAVFVTDDGEVHCSSGIGDDSEIQFFPE